MSASAAGVEGEVQRYLRHNLVVNIADGTAWFFGYSFVSTATILPVYVSHLTTSTVLIGLVPALESLGWYLPQLLVAPLVEGLARVKPVLLGLSLGERIPFLLIGLVIWAVPAQTNDSRLALILFFAFLGLRMFASGVSAIPWQELIARVIPTRRRGRFFAAQRFFGGIAGLASAALAVELLGRVPYPLSYALCFFFAFLSVMISWVCLAQTIEPHQNPAKAREDRRSYWRELPRILREDRNFATYLGARALGFLGTMATGFFAVHAIEAFQLQDAQAGVFTAILLVSSALANPGWGWLGDRWGQKLVLAAASAFYALALSLAWWSETLAAYYVVFFLVGVANAGMIISDLTLVLEFAPPARRLTYVGLARGLLGPWIGFAPILGGILLGQFSYGVMIAAAWALSAMGLGLLAARVREPRRSTA